MTARGSHFDSYNKNMTYYRFSTTIFSVVESLIGMKEKWKENWKKELVSLLLKALYSGFSPSFPTNSFSQSELPGFKHIFHAKLTKNWGNYVRRNLLEAVKPERVKQSRGERRLTRKGTSS